jgi:hypothetical protein
MTWRVARRRDDPYAVDNLEVTLDGGEFDAGGKRPIWDCVVRRLSCFDFGTLHEDLGVAEAVVLATVVEVQMRGNHGVDVFDPNAVSAQCLVQVVMHRRVQPVDEGAVGSNPCVDDDWPGWVRNEIAADRKCRSRPRKVRRWRDISQVQAMYADHGTPIRIVTNQSMEHPKEAGSSPTSCKQPAPYHPEVGPVHSLRVADIKTAQAVQPPGPLFQIFQNLVDNLIEHMYDIQHEFGENNRA